MKRAHEPMPAGPGTPGPHWITSSFGEAADASPVELSALGEHLARCRGAHGRLFELQRSAEAVIRFIASRQVTTLLALLALAGIASWWA